MNPLIDWLQRIRDAVAKLTRPIHVPRVVDVPDSSGHTSSAELRAAQDSMDRPPILCNGMRVEFWNDGLWWGVCLRCGRKSGYNESRVRCPVMRGSLWKPRPSSDGRWYA